MKFDLKETVPLLRECLKDVQTMVGFRNIAVHNHLTLGMAIVFNVLDTRLGDFTAFTAAMLRQA